MKVNELVGKCSSYGKTLYCMDGFFNGVHTEDQLTLCFECHEKKEKSADS